MRFGLWILARDMGLEIWLGEIDLGRGEDSYSLARAAKCAWLPAKQHPAVYEQALIEGIAAVI